MAWAGLCAILVRAGLRRELGLSIASVALASLHLWCQGPLHMYTLRESEVQNISLKQKQPPVYAAGPGLRAQAEKEQPVNTAGKMAVSLPGYLG